MRFAIALIIALALFANAAWARNHYINWEDHKHEDLTLHVGSTVTWISGDEAPHRIQSVDKMELKGLDFNSAKNATHTFSNEGEFLYSCAFHPEHKNVIKVISLVPQKAVYPWLAGEKKADPYSAAALAQRNKRIIYEKTVNSKKNANNEELVPKNSTATPEHPTPSVTPSTKGTHPATPSSDAPTKPTKKPKKKDSDETILPKPGDSSAHKGKGGINDEAAASTEATKAPASSQSFATKTSSNIVLLFVSCLFVVLFL
ncbi:hypothetical protein CYY_001314 [Polysphondylium violaceum]|uniref:Blue (type 1) copper domain-containing protein n=1 Tax=Polysphondylium violaceum TaxID=133409 RepID=A0A8J4UWB6_9MYCE|nr:hypothetical protein CYY_001314 [Polysphondylium violaceum]